MTDQGPGILLAWLHGSSFLRMVVVVDTYGRNRVGEPGREVGVSAIMVRGDVDDPKFR